MRDTIEMAMEVGLLSGGANKQGIYAEALEHLVSLARADEREACAKVCENWTQTPETTGMELALCAAAIRARNKE
jgi:hypothetical protein